LSNQAWSGQLRKQ